LHLPIFVKIFQNQKLKIPSKLDFKLEFTDFDKNFFAMNSKYGNIFIVFFKDFYITYSLKSFLKDYVLN
jgi:hypothetical protein